MTLFFWILATILVVIGIAGTVLPALPGAPLVFAGLLIAAWIDGFQKVGWIPLTILAILTAVSFAVDFLSTSLGAKKAGASRGAIIGAAIGTVAGLFLGFVGIFAGPFIGAVAGELISRGTQEKQQALRAGLFTWLGIVIGTAIKIALVFTMLGLFALAYLF